MPSPVYGRKASIRDWESSKSENWDESRAWMLEGEVVQIVSLPRMRREKVRPLSRERRWVL